MSFKPVAGTPKKRVRPVTMAFTFSMIGDREMVERFRAMAKELDLSNAQLLRQMILHCLEPKC